jgi:transporter family-2 protein
MAYVLAFVSGLLLALMIYFNGLLSSTTTFYWGNVIFHGIGLLLFSLALMTKGPTQLSTLEKDFDQGIISIALPGFLGALTIILSNIVIMNIGVTLLVGISLLGQMATSMMIDSKGLLGKEKKNIHLAQIGGSGLILTGVWLLLG